MVFVFGAQQGCCAELRLKGSKRLESGGLLQAKVMPNGVRGKFDAQRTAVFLSAFGKSGFGMYFCGKNEAMKDLVISVHKQIGGYNFGLSPKVRKEMSRLFPGSAFPLPHVFVSIENKMDFEEIYGRLEKHILPFLTGIEVKKLSEHFERAVFFDNATDTVLFKIPLTRAYVEEN